MYEFLKEILLTLFVLALFIGTLWILFIFFVISIPNLIGISECIKNLECKITDIITIIISSIALIISIVAVDTYIRSAKNQEFTNLLTKRSIIHTLQKDFRDNLYTSLTTPKDDTKNKDNTEYAIKYQITPPLIGLLNTYNSMVGIYFKSDESYKNLFDGIFLNEIKEFFNYKIYKDLLENSYDKINLGKDYPHLTKYIELHNISVVDDKVYIYKQF